MERLPADSSWGCWYCLDPNISEVIVWFSIPVYTLDIIVCWRLMGVGSLCVVHYHFYVSMFCRICFSAYAAIYATCFVSSCFACLFAQSLVPMLSAVASLHIVNACLRIYSWMALSLCEGQNALILDNVRGPGSTWSVSSD